MFTKTQRLINLNHTRQDISRPFKQLMAEHNLTLNDLARMTSWSPLYLQMITDYKATPNIGEINYLASLFDKKIRIEFVD